MRNGPVLIALALLAVHGGLRGEEETAPAPEKRVYRFLHSLERNNIYAKTIVHVALPVDEPGRQRITALGFDPEPTRILTENGTRVAEWVWTGRQPVIEIRVHVQAELWPHRPGEGAEARPAPLSLEARTRYTSPEPFQESDLRAIREAAAGIEAGKTDWDTVVKVEAEVCRRLRHDAYNPDDRGAAAALESGVGDCTEYTDLFVALCRAKGIPARSRMCLLDSTTDVPLHTVAEVYLEDRGWVALDPLRTDLTRLGDPHRPMRLLYLSNRRNDPLLFGHFTDKAYFVWDREKAGAFKTRVGITYPEQPRVRMEYRY